MIDMDESLLLEPLIDNGVELLTEKDCRRLLGTVSLGRVGLAGGGVPVILPVAYGLAGEDIVFRTGEGLKLDGARAHSTMAFQVDHFESDLRSGWSVLVAGTAEEIDAGDLFPAEATRLRAAAPGDRRHIVRIRPDVISGRRFGCLRW
jgi:nitroimidazol reductase NimA-like FMN-containing flavoprotein (pyridoxamine 5'-phosphate oxidase superfamily)